MPPVAHAELGGTVKVQTLLKGEIEVDDDHTINFIKPMIGFPDTTRYVIFQTETGPLYWLQSLDDPQTCFCVLAPFAAGIDVDMAIGPTEAFALGADSADQIDVYSVVVLGETSETTRTNLRAPILVNGSNGRALQVILEDPNLPIQYPLGVRRAPPGRTA